MAGPVESLLETPDAVDDFIAAPGEINPAVVQALRERGVTIAVPAWRAPG